MIFVNAFLTNCLDCYCANFFETHHVKSEIGNLGKNRKMVDYKRLLVHNLQFATLNKTKTHKYESN